MMRCEEVQRAIAPVVVLLRIELKDRHQFHGSDAQVTKVGDFFDETNKAAALAVRHSGRSSGKATDMHFINNQLGWIMANRLVPFPWERDFRQIYCP